MTAGGVVQRFIFFKSFFFFLVNVGRFLCEVRPQPPQFYDRIESAPNANSVPLTSCLQLLTYIHLNPVVAASGQNKNKNSHWKKSRATFFLHQKKIKNLVWWACWEDETFTGCMQADGIIDLMTIIWAEPTVSGPTCKPPKRSWTWKLKLGS